MLVTLHDLIAAARRDRYGLGAFNTYNLEITAGIVAAAEDLRAPVIVQTGAGALRGASRLALPALVLALARSARVPVAVHLDHAIDLGLIDQMIASGYTSVMIDGSSELFDRNVVLTRRAVERGHAAGVTVEAELGGIAGQEDVAEAGESAFFTDPEMAGRFVAETGVDLLAVAIGNVHGFYRGEPRLQFERLATLRDTVPVPLVLHGASGLSDDALKRAIGLGVAKINFNTELRQALFAALEEAIPESRRGYDVASLMQSSTAAVREIVTEKLTLLGAVGRGA